MNVVYLKPKLITYIDTKIDANGIKTFICFSKINKIKKYTIVSSTTNCLIGHEDLSKIKSYYSNMNPHLEKILKRVGDLTREFDQFNAEEKALFNFYHTFTSNIETVYIDNFDEIISECNLSLIIEALKFENNAKLKNIVIGTNNIEKYQLSDIELFSLKKDQTEIEQKAA